MENTKIVQLHEIIKNSLATYLSYKWSDDRLYLKKRGNKDKKNDNRKKKKVCGTIGQSRSIINLENNVFVYDASNKTFTQLDLCECFKNGVKYRKTDPFSTKSLKRNFDLYDVEQKSPTDLREYQSYQLVNVNDSVEHIFSNHMLKKGNWTKAINDLYPSKFDLFIQKELNKCTGKNFDMKSFKINTKQETNSTSNNDKVCSSAAIAGYYTITTYDDGLQCENDVNKGRKLSTKQCNFIGIREETVCPKKFYSKGLQCDLSDELHRREKGSKDLGIQCYYAPDQPRYNKSRKKQMENKTGSSYSHNKSTPLQRQRITPSKKMRTCYGSFSDIFPTFEDRNNGNMMQLDSSAEIRKILNAQSDSSLSMSNTREFFNNCTGSKPLSTYYRASSTSKDRGGDTNDDKYTKNEPIIGMLEASKYNKISKVDTMAGSNRTFKTSHNTKISNTHNISASHRTGSSKRSEGHHDEHHPESHHPDDSQRHTPSISNKTGSPNTNASTISKKTGGSKMSSKVHSGAISHKSGSIKELETDENGDVIAGVVPVPLSASKKSQLSPLCSVHCKKFTPGKEDLCTCTYENTKKPPPEPLYKEQRFPTVCYPRCSATCGLEQKSVSLTCAEDCPCPGQTDVEKQDPTKPCTCLPPPRQSCCNCNSPAACICQLLCNLRERIRMQTEEQNRNLDQILEELDKQDQEIQWIRQVVEKSRRRNRHRKCVRKSGLCDCYPVTVEYDFNSFPPETSEKLMENDEMESLEEDFVEMKPQEPELVKIYGLNNKSGNKERISEKESWKAIWKKNSKNIFSNDFFKRKNNIAREKYLSSSSGPVEDIKLNDKKIKKETRWFSKLVSSKRNLKKTTS